MGIVVKDHGGMVHAASCATMDFITDPMIAKAHATHKAAKLVQRLGLRKIVLEKDALEIVSVLKQMDGWMGIYRRVRSEAKQMLSTCVKW